MITRIAGVHQPWHLACISARHGQGRRAHPIQGMHFIICQKRARGDCFTISGNGLDDSTQEEGRNELQLVNMVELHCAVCGQARRQIASASMSRVMTTAASTQGVIPTAAGTLGAMTMATSALGVLHPMFLVSIACQSWTAGCA